MVYQTSDVLHASAKIVWECLALSVAYGILTMALLQFWKDMFDRRHFNRNEFNKFFPSSDSEATAVRSQLIQLAAGGDEAALFGLPIDKLAGQINVAAGTVIESPTRYTELLRVLSYGAPEDDLALLTAKEPPRPKPTGTSPEDADFQILYADSRTRVSHQIQRNIDRLQLSTSQAWTRRNQFFSIVISLMLGLLPIGLAPLFPSGTRFLNVTGFVPISISLAIIGGFLAPILRDLAAHASQKV